MIRTDGSSLWSRVVAIVCALLMTLTVLTGCTGDRAAADFEAAFGGDPAVASLDLTSHDNQPFTGGVSGDLRTVTGLSDDEFIALVDRVSAYTVEHAESMRGRITVTGDDVALVVRGSQAADAARVTFVLGLRTEPGVTTVGLVGAERDTLSAEVAGVEDALALVARLPDVAAAHGLDVAPEFRVRTADGTTDLAGAAGDTLAAARDAWTTLSDVVSVSSLRVSDTGITITLTNEVDAAAAAAAAAGLPDAIRFASPTVRLGTDADGTLARAFLAGLGDEVRAQIAYVWESAGALRVTAADAERLPALAVMIAIDPTIDPTLIRLGADAEPSVEMALPMTGHLDVYAAAVADLIAGSTVTELRVTDADVSVTVGELSDAELAAFAPALKLVATPGARVCVQRPDDAVCITAASSVDAGDVRAAGTAFVDAWNAAPSAP